jgi:DNA mismatch repair protein MutL
MKKTTPPPHLHTAPASTEEGRIQVLPPHVVNRIAAGEVVERPASVIKELVENSVDAGATRIDITASDGGQHLRVCDNGKGMAPKDIGRCILNHATSKIHSADDLDTLTTMGFRGEALATISAISRFRCISRRAEDTDGLELCTEGGTPPTLHPTGSAPGTIMEVHDLFYNTPARLKFLKKPATELAAIDEMVKSLALAHPQVSMCLDLNGRTAFRTTGEGLALETVRSLFPLRPEQERHVLHTTFEDTLAGYRFEAVFASPACESLQKKSKKQWWMLLNRRPIRCPVLQRAIAAAYESLVPHGQCPLCVIWLHLPPETVDVNVHPTKREVRYENPGQVYQFVYGGLRRALAQHFHQTYDTLPSPASSAEMETATSSFMPSGPMHTEPEMHFSPFSDAGLPTPPRTDIFASTPPEHSSTPIRYQTQSLWAHEVASQGVSPQSPSALHTKRWRVIGQLYATYILLETPTGLMVVDQHIASERWCFEALQARDARQGRVVQPLLTPLLFSPSASEMAYLHEHTELFQQMGFNCRPAPDDSRQWQLWSMPVLYPERAHQQDSVTDQLKHMLAQLETQPQAEPDTEYLYATMACHMAIRAGDILTHTQQERVVEDWLQCHLPWSCPHGRPIAHTIDAAALNAFFARPSLPVNAGFGDPGLS